MMCLGYHIRRMCTIQSYHLYRVPNQLIIGVFIYQYNCDDTIRYKQTLAQINIAPSKHVTITVVCMLCVYCMLFVCSVCVCGCLYGSDVSPRSIQEYRSGLPRETELLQGSILSNQYCITNN